MATIPITCPNCGYKNYHPEATACEQCYAPLKPTAGSEESGAEGKTPQAKPAETKKSAAKSRPAAPLPGAQGGTSPFNAVLYVLALPLTFLVAIFASVSGQRQREVLPGVWLLVSTLTLCGWLLAWYTQTGEGAPDWMVWPPVALFVCALFGGALMVRVGEPTPGLVGLGIGLTGLAVYGGLQVLEPTPESMSGHAAPINAIAVTPGGDRLLSGSEDGNLRLWDLSTGRSVEFAGHSDGVASVLWVPSADPLTIDFGGKVKVWTLGEQPAANGEWEAGLGLSCATISPNGRQVAVGTLTGNVEKRNTKDGSGSETVTSGGGAVSALAFSPNSSSLAVGQLDGTFAVYGSLEARFEIDEDATVRALEFANGNDLVAGLSTGVLKVYSVKTGEEVATLSGGPEAPVLDLAVRGSTLVSLHNNRTVARWDLNSKKLAGTSELPVGQGNSGPPSQVAILPSGDLLVANGRAVTRVWAGSMK